MSKRAVLYNDKEVFIPLYMPLSAIRVPESTTPVWAIKGLLNYEIKSELLKLLQNMPMNIYTRADSGNKLSLEHKSGSGKLLFKNSVCQKLAQILTDPYFVDLMSDLLTESNSKFRVMTNDRNQRLKPLAFQKLWKNSSFNNKAALSWDLNLHDINIEPRRLVKHYTDAFNCIPFMPRMQFSIMQYGTFIPPHTDVSNKIATLMIYLPTSVNQSKTYLGTTFWNLKNNSRVKISQSESKFLNHHELVLFKENYTPVRTLFQDTSCILFFRSDDSWHSFEHDISGQAERYSININFLYPVSRDT